MDIFSNPKPLTSLNSVIYLSKRMNKQMRAEIDKWSNIYLEQGFNIKWVYDGFEVLKKTFPVKNAIYSSVDDFIKRNTVTNNLAYEKFKAFFYFYVAFIALYTTFKIFNLLFKGRAF